MTDRKITSERNTSMAKKKMSAKNMQILIKFLIVVNIILIIAVIILAILLKRYKNEADLSSSNLARISNSGYTVCIDAGHGGDDTGTIGIDGSYEKDDNLSLALLVADALEAQGVNVILTRSDDTFVELDNRAAIANNADADLFVSLHRNYSEGSADTKGIEIWIHSSGSAKSKDAANDIMSELEEAGISENRGIKQGTQGSTESNYAVIRETVMTSMIIEMGFMSNETDLKLFNTNKQDYAQAIADGIITWLKDYK
jgi:N-acetylmuramoyl-L-alanine amidase